MDFKESLKFLGISEYEERIFKSNSHGELFHLTDYIWIAENVRNLCKETAWFKPWFDSVVEWANESWNRPESIYQHMSKIFKDCCKK